MNTHRVRLLVGYAGGLVTIDGMADAWGISRQGAVQYVDRHPDFPDPLPLDVYRTGGTERNRRVWLFAEVDAYRPLR